MSGHRFTQGFREATVLADGTRALLRLLRPEGAPLLAGQVPVEGS